MLEVQNISINYGSSKVIKDISFTLQANKIVAVLGANGAGKTTLLKALNGSLPISSGTILLGEKSLESFSRREIAQRMTVVAQENETKFPVTVLEFVLSGRFAHGGVFGWESEDDLNITQNALEMCDLKDYETRMMNELSGGERQRVVFARALATGAGILLLDEPTANLVFARALATGAGILLLDEPTANLDLSHQNILFRLVRERCRSCNSSAVIITHDLNLASEFADEILLLKRGEVIAKGGPQEVLTTENLQAVFEVKVFLDGHPVSGKPRITMNY